MTAHFTGRDISGQAVMLVTRETVEASGFDAGAMRCEGCGRGL